MPDVDFHAVSLQWHSGLTTLLEAYNTTFPEGHPMVAKLEDMLDIVRQKRFTVAVMGEFNRGKSSLINALLGSAVLPTDVVPTTSVVNRIVYSQQPALTAHFRDGHAERLENAASLSRYVTKLTNESSEFSATIREVEIGYPIALCQNGISIIDTPGLNDEADVTHVSMEALSHSDSVVMTVSAELPLSRSEKELLLHILSQGRFGSILFACTFIDRLAEKDRPRILAYLTERITKDMNKLLDESELTGAALAQAKADVEHPIVFGISAKQALTAMETNDAALLEESGFPMFRSRLLDNLTARQSAYMVSYIGGTLTNQSAMYQKDVRHERERLQKQLSRRQSLLQKREELVEKVNPTLQGVLMLLDDPAILPNTADMLNDFMKTPIQLLSALRDDSRDAICAAMMSAYREYMETQHPAMLARVRGGLSDAYESALRPLDKLLDQIRAYDDELRGKPSEPVTTPSAFARGFLMTRKVEHEFYPLINISMEAWCSEPITTYRALLEKDMSECAYGKPMLDDLLCQLRMQLIRYAAECVKRDDDDIGAEARLQTRVDELNAAERFLTPPIQHCEETCERVMQDYWSTQLEGMRVEPKGADRS